MGQPRWRRSAGRRRNKLGLHLPGLLGRELGHVVIPIRRHDHDRGIALAVGCWWHHHREAWWKLGHVPRVGRFRLSGCRRLYCDLYCASGDVDDGRSQDAGRVGQIRQVADVGRGHGLGHGLFVALRCAGGPRGVGVPLRGVRASELLPNIRRLPLVSARSGRALAGGSYPGLPGVRSGSPVGALLDWDRESRRCCRGDGEDNFALEQTITY